jgi:hypothetical protein
MGHVLARARAHGPISGAEGGDPRRAGGHHLRLPALGTVAPAATNGGTCHSRIDPLPTVLVGRILKNSLFYRSENGARVGDTFMSLIHTVELGEGNPFDYLVALLRHHELVADEPESWLPWNYRQALDELRTSTTP